MAKALYITADISQSKEVIDTLKRVMSEKQFENAMAGVMRETGRHVKTILGKDVPQRYNVTQADVRREVGSPNNMHTGRGVGCTIPVVGPRRNIGRGGRTQRGYPAWGSLYGWATLRRPPYRVRTRIIRGNSELLPVNMPKTGHKPFRNAPGSKLNNLTFSREGKKLKKGTNKWTYPIQPAMGPAIPQMPLNRSKDDVQDDITEYLNSRIEHRLQALIRNGR